MTDDEPVDLGDLRELALTGRDELTRNDPATDPAAWAAIEARLGPIPTPQAEAAPVTTARRAVAWWPTAAAAAVALVVGVATGSLLTSVGTDATPTTLATVELAPLTDDAAPTTAQLVDGPDGRTIDLDLSALPATDGFHEVWLLDPATGALVSLGPARADSTYVVPDTVDLVQLPVLDVSVEPHDGDPAHSGASVLRGDVTWLG